MLCAGTSWDGMFFPERHIAERLANYCTVLYVDPPLTILAKWRRPELAASLRRPHFRQVAHNLYRVTPLAPPFQSVRGSSALCGALLRRTVGSAVKRIGRPVKAVIVANADGRLDIVEAQRRIVYAFDDVTAGAELMGLAPSALIRAQQHHLQMATDVIAISPTLVERWNQLGYQAVLIPNGCDAEAFSSCDQVDMPSDVTLPGPIAGYIGHISDRIDFGILTSLAQEGISLLLVGPASHESDRKQLDRLLEHPSVQWVGKKSFAEMPSYLRAIDVGITPYRDNAFNRASFPLKTLEYLAAGRAVVSTPLPVTTWLNTDLIVTADPENFATAVQLELRALRTEERVAERRRFARLHTWDHRVDDLVRLLNVQPATTVGRADTCCMQLNR